MKFTTRSTRLLTALAIACLAPCLALRAAPLAGDTPVRAAPEADAQIIVMLAAGAEPVIVAPATPGSLPVGWQSVEIAETKDVWVRDSDLNKELEVKPGSELRTAPQPDAPVYAVMAPGDSTDLRGIQGKWVQMRINKKRIGYINISDVVTVTGDAAAKKQETRQQQTPPPEGAPAPEFVASGLVSATAVQPAPKTQTPAPAQTQPAQTPAPAPAPTFGAEPSAIQTPPPRPAETRPAAAVSFPRNFEGVFASTRRAFAPRRPYDYQLTDPSGTRYAYLDLSKLLTTQQFENFLGHTVVVYGSMSAVPNTRDIVINVETLQLK